MRRGGEKAEYLILVLGLEPLVLMRWSRWGLLVVVFVVFVVAVGGLHIAPWTDRAPSTEVFLPSSA